MSKKINLFAILVLALMVIFTVSCEGPAGPAGADGANGIDGIDASSFCSDCHNRNQEITAREVQWAASGHGSGPNFERSEGECAICHTSQGFLGNLDGSYDWTAEGAKIDNPTHQNCYTCHDIHNTYTEADLALNVSGAVELNNLSEAVDFGKGSMCAGCHQARILTFPVVGGADVAITSPYWGVHHGPQANVFAGMGLYDAGSGYSGNSAASHGELITDACVMCHMAEAYGTQAGGHTMGMTYDYHGHAVLNTAGCVSCHSDLDALETDVEELTAEVGGKLDSLKTLLDAAGVTAAGDNHPIPGSYAPGLAGAFINFQALTEDRSLGVHNPAYVNYILDASIASLNP